MLKRFFMLKKLILPGAIKRLVLIILSHNGLN
jgi:hypothetical protein